MQKEIKKYSAKKRLSRGLYTTICLQSQGSDDWRHYGYRTTKRKAPSLLQFKQLVCEHETWS